MLYRISALALMAVFYAIYIGKMIAQRKEGVRTSQIGRGRKAPRVLWTEYILMFATCAIVVVELLSLFSDGDMPAPVRVLGACLALIGVGIFGLAVWTMRDSWRAGIPEKDKTRLVTGGIFSLSRNPAFLGFDLCYIGLLLMFFNWVHLAFALLAIVMLHLQILREEEFLATAFGKPYLDYKARVRRYIGRRR